MPVRLGPKRQVRAIAGCLMLIGSLFVSCETANYAPAVSTPRKTEITKLERGRQLFVRRCIECHTLPPIWKYSREDWPQIVNDMAHRASLKPDEREAIIAYILAARRTANQFH